MPAIPVVTAPQYSAAPLTRNHQPPKARPYAQYRECLRREFSYTCVYCLATEREVGPADAHGDFEIEHFRPQADPRFSRFSSFYPNLFWACGKCNGVKQDVWPDAAEIALGMYFVDPCVDGLGNHLEITGVSVRALSPAGEYMIDEIGLNSEVQQYRRGRRATLLTVVGKLEATADSYRAIGFEGALNKAELEAKLRDLEHDIAELKAEIEPTAPPWDATSACLCTSSASKKPKKLTRKQRKQRRLAKYAPKTR